ncbi:MAG: hypothetical protein HQ515_03885 [Phycisphaeraceae bacterium]|nr:hypothetical protein [Phycisphaeraceae bacterium]
MDDTKMKKEAMERLIEETTGLVQDHIGFFWAQWDEFIKCVDESAKEYEKWHDIFALNKEYRKSLTYMVDASGKMIEAGKEQDWATEKKWEDEVNALDQNREAIIQSITDMYPELSGKYIWSEECPSLNFLKIRYECPFAAPVRLVNLAKGCLAKGFHHRTLDERETLLTECARLSVLNDCGDLNPTDKAVAWAGSHTRSMLRTDSAYLDLLGQSGFIWALWDNLVDPPKTRVVRGALRLVRTVLEPRGGQGSHCKDTSHAGTSGIECHRDLVVENEPTATGEGGSIEPTVDDNTFMTIREFISVHCAGDYSGNRVNSLATTLMTYGQKGRLQLPPHKDDWRSGKPKQFLVGDLLHGWPDYCEEVPNLPELKAPDQGDANHK